MMWKKILLLIGILMAFTILVAPPAVSAQNTSANTIYFIPQHGVIQEPSNNITAQVRANLNADSPINVWQTNIIFDPACVSVIDVTYPAGEGWDPAAPWGWSSGEIKIGNIRQNCGDVGSDILLANLTIHCEQWGCTSLLNFSGIVNVARFIGCTETLQKYHAAWINGTVTIETGEQNGEEPHAPKNGNSRGRGASQPSPSPTFTPTATSTPTETPTFAPTFTPSASATPAQTPSSTIPPPTTIEQKRILMLVIGLMAGSIMAIIIYVVFKLREK